MKTSTEKSSEKRMLCNKDVHKTVAKIHVRYLCRDFSKHFVMFTYQPKCSILNCVLEI